MSVVATFPVAVSSLANVAASRPALSSLEVMTAANSSPGNATADRIAVAPMLPVPHTATRRISSHNHGRVIRLTATPQDCRRAAPIRGWDHGGRKPSHPSRRRHNTAPTAPN